MKTNKKKKLIEYDWLAKIIVSSFIISIIFTAISETVIPNVGIILGIVLALIFILIGVIFDMIGIAVAAADESQFNSMAAKKVKGAKISLKLKRNAAKVSSFCNDVVGDICGIVSGSTGAVITIKMIELYKLNSLVTTLVVMGIISALTIGGKALEKGYAMEKSNNILYEFSKFLSLFYKE